MLYNASKVVTSLSDLPVIQDHRTVLCHSGPGRPFEIGFPPINPSRRYALDTSSMVLDHREVTERRHSL